MKNAVDTPLRSMWFFLFVGAVVWMSGLMSAQTHYVYHLAPDSPLLDIQGTPVIQSDDNPIAGQYGSFLSQVQTGNTLLYIDLNMVFATSGLKLGDVAGFTYYTRKTDESVAYDWSARVYTIPDGSGHWFQYRFDAIQPNAEDTDWTQWDANATGYFELMNDRTGNSNVTTGAPGSGTWSDIANHATYGEAELLSFGFFLGENSNVNPIYNHIALIEFMLANGDTATLHLVPEPAHIAAILLTALFALVFWRRYLRSRKD